MKTLLWTILLLIPATGAMAQTPDSEPANTSAQAQEPIKDWTQMSAADYARLNLPPLHLLMKNARQRSPKVGQFATKTEIEERELKNIRRNWLAYFKLNSNFSYGTTDTSNQTYYDNAQLPMVQNLTGSTQRWWNVGASFSMPISEIFTRRNKIQQQKIRIESIQSETENEYDNLCLKIIESYTRAEQNLRVLSAAAQKMISGKAQYATAEADFVNSKIDARTLHIQKEMEVSAIREYEQVRSQLTQALLELELLSKTPIISRPEEILPN